MTGDDHGAGSPPKDSADTRTPMGGKRKQLVLVGNGMAGVRTLEHLLRIAPDLYDITVFGAERHANYNRILLSPLLAGEMQLPDIMLNDVAWYRDHGIRLQLGKRVVNIDRARREVIAEDGTSAVYDRLLLATGSTPVSLPVPGSDLDGVLTYREIADAQAMIAAARHCRRAVVIGGGLLGLEAAAGLKARGMDVTVVHVMDWLMERQLDSTAAGLLRQSLEKRGIRVLLSRQTTAILGERGRVRAVQFNDGGVADADLVVMAVGVRPNTALAEACGLRVNRGVVVDDTLQTFDPRIYAVGECANHRGISYGLVAPLFDMAQVCAMHLAQFGIKYYAGSVPAAKLKVTGIDVFSAGRFTENKSGEAIVLRDRRRDVYKKLVIENDRLVGGVLYGDTANASRYFAIICEGRNIAPIRHELMFLQ